MIELQQAYILGVVTLPAIWFILKLPGWGLRLVDAWFNRGELVTIEESELWKGQLK